MNDLERRYLRLMRAYPPDYRRSRGAEIVGTYLDLAEPDRRWPSPADAADLLRGGLRQRLRAAGLLNLAGGARLAAVLSFLVASVLAGAWLAVELRPVQAEWKLPRFGPFASLGVIAWAAWLTALVTAAVSPLRARAMLASALLLTVATVPASALMDLPRPPLFVLLPQVVLGAMALLMPDRRSILVRIGAPLAAMSGGAMLTLLRYAELADTDHGGYDYGRGKSALVVAIAGGLLLAGALLVGIRLALDRDSRGAWAALLLLMPVGHLWLYPLAGYVHSVRDSSTAAFTTIAALAAVVTLLAVLVLLSGVAIHQRLANLGRGGADCPACGAHRRELPSRP